MIEVTFTEFCAGKSREGGLVPEMEQDYNLLSVKRVSLKCIKLDLR